MSAARRRHLTLFAGFFALGCLVAPAACSPNEDVYAQDSGPPDNNQGPGNNTTPGNGDGNGNGNGNGNGEPNSDGSFFGPDGVYFPPGIEECAKVSNAPEPTERILALLPNVPSPLGLVVNDQSEINTNITRTLFHASGITYLEEGYPPNDPAISNPLGGFAYPRLDDPEDLRWTAFWRDWTGLLDAASKPMLQRYDEANRVDPERDLYMGASYFEARSALQGSVHNMTNAPDGSSAEDDLVIAVVAGRVLRYEIIVRFDQDPECHVRNLRRLYFLMPSEDDPPQPPMPLSLNYLLDQEQQLTENLPDLRRIHLIKSYFKWAQEKQMGGASAKLHILSSTTTDELAELPQLEAWLERAQRVKLRLHGTSEPRESHGAVLSDYAQLALDFTPVLEEFAGKTAAAPSEQSLLGQVPMPDGWRVLYAPTIKRGNEPLITE